MKAKYYDPFFYIVSDKMPFSIAIKGIFNDKINPEALNFAVKKAIKRYPYFALRVIKENEEYYTVENKLPVVVYEGTDLIPFGTEKLNYHMLSVSYYDNVISVNISHVVTDGGGLYPFLKTLYYYYLSEKLGITLDNTDINLTDGKISDDEIRNPYPEEKMSTAQPFYTPDKGDYFKLVDGGFVTDEKKTVYFLKINQADFMKFNRSNDGSPCSLAAVLATKAIWQVHPNEKKNIVCDVSFNCRPGLGAAKNHRMLSDSFPLIYTNKLRNKETSELCTYSRGMVMLNSQEENVLYKSEQWRKEYYELEKIKTLNEKKKIYSQKALSRANANTFSVSYVGKLDYKFAEPYMNAMYNLTDGSTHRDFFIEINSFGEWFDVAFIQGFSSDVYYKAFLKQLEDNNIRYIEKGFDDLRVSDISLP